MKKKKENLQGITAVLDQMLKDNGMYYRVKGKYAIDLFKKMMGAHLMPYIDNVRFINGVLYVNLNNSVLREELKNGMETLCKTINKELGEHMIEKIVLR